MSYIVQFPELTITVDTADEVIELLKHQKMIRTLMLPSTQAQVVEPVVIPPQEAPDA